jgi:hypothetical protein
LFAHYYSRQTARTSLIGYIQYVTPPLVLFLSIIPFIHPFHILSFHSIHHIAPMDHRQPPPNKTAELDPVLHSIGFQIEEVSPSQVTGRLPVTPKCCQVRYVRPLIDRSSACARRLIDSDALPAPHGTAAVPGAPRRRVGAGGGGPGQHGRAHGVGLPPGCRRQPHHQPLPQRQGGRRRPRPRRPAPRRPFDAGTLRRRPQPGVPRR